MKYSNFEDLPVWKDGIELAKAVFLLTEDKSFFAQGDIANQLQRAALSVPNNISEGFERGTTKELITFIYYAKGSAGEVRSIFHVLDELSRYAHLKSQISDLKLLATSISRQLSAWASSLQDTDIQGARYMTGQSKQSYQQNKKADELMKKLKHEHEQRLKELNRKREG